MVWQDEVKKYMWKQDCIEGYIFLDLEQTFSYEWVPKNDFSYFSTKTHIVGTQKNRLNETILLSTQNICKKWWVRKKNTTLR